MTYNFIDLTGAAFGRLTVIGRAPKSGRRPRWNCRCACGNELVVLGESLRCGHTSSCGCLRADQASINGKALVRHGHRRRRESPTYCSWKSMLARCSRSNVNSSHLYLGRGITVCERWMSFENFLADMGERPAGKTLDRIDNDKGYEPGNCRWATPKEQRANQRSQP